MSTLSNSEGPDEMLHNAAFCQGLHRLLYKINHHIIFFFFFFFLEIITSFGKMDHPDLTVSNFMENAISLKRVKGPAEYDEFIQFLKS